MFRNNVKDKQNIEIDILCTDMFYCPTGFWGWELKQEWFRPRIGIINICSENYLYHDPGDFIKTSRMAFSELVDNDDNDIEMLSFFCDFP